MKSRMLSAPSPAIADSKSKYGVSPRTKPSHAEPSSVKGSICTFGESRPATMPSISLIVGATIIRGSLPRAGSPMLAAQPCSAPYENSIKCVAKSDFQGRNWMYAEAAASNSARMPDVRVATRIRMGDKLALFTLMSLNGCPPNHLMRHG